jgi:hypothetical protein
MPLTNFFVFYVTSIPHREQDPSLVTRRPTFRIPYSLELKCRSPQPSGGCGGPNCTRSCFPATFFPWKPLLHDDGFNDHFQAAQYALADASFNAAAPALGASGTSVMIADVIVPIVTDHAVLLRDCGETCDDEEEFRFPLQDNVLVMKSRFPQMNRELGIRSELLLPIHVSHGLRPKESQGLLKHRFGIEFYSPMPDWFRPAGPRVLPTGEANEPTYRLVSRERGTSLEPTSIPKPAVVGMSSSLEDLNLHLQRVIALMYNLSEYGEIKALQFVHWIGKMINERSRSPFSPLLRDRFIQSMEYGALSSEQRMGFDAFWNFLSRDPGHLSLALNIPHKELLVGRLTAALATPSAPASCFSEMVGRASNEVEGVSAGSLPYRGFCIERDLEGVFDRSKDYIDLLSQVAVEFFRNHKRHRMDVDANAPQPLWHICWSDNQRSHILHFCSPGAHLPLSHYALLRQGQPHVYLRQDPRTSGEPSEARTGGIGLSLLRRRVEDRGLDMIVELGRSSCGLAAHDFLIAGYRRDFHLKVAFEVSR